METKRPLVVFLLDGQRYALDLAGVQRTIRSVAITALPKAPPIVLGVIDLGGIILPVINIRERFNHTPRGIHLSDLFIIAEAGKRTLALPVETVSGVIEISSEDYAPAGDILPGLELIKGAVRLEDGLILIHDLDRLLSLDEEMAIDSVLISHDGEENEMNAVNERHQGGALEP